MKLWSLRSQGDGSNVSTCQWTYTAHRKSVLSLTFVESMRLVASCDSVVHIWDPFMGVNVGHLESSRFPPVNVLKSLPAPSSLLTAATTDGTVRIIDTRTCSYIQELKVISSRMNFKYFNFYCLGEFKSFWIDSLFGSCSFRIVDCYRSIFRYNHSLRFAYWISVINVESARK